MKKLQKSILACLFSLSITSLNAQSFNEIIKAVASDRAAMDNFGTSVSISGDYAIITAPGDGESATGVNSMSYAGSAYIFERNSSGIWIEVQKIVTSDRAVDDQFGASASISGDYAVVSTIYEDEDATGGNTMNSAGSAYIFERNSLGVWHEVQKIVASDRNADDNFGSSVSISGDYVIVGAHLADIDVTGGNNMSAAGSAYLFERNSLGVWHEVQKIIASDRRSLCHSYC